MVTKERKTTRGPDTSGHRPSPLGFEVAVPSQTVCARLPWGSWMQEGTRPCRIFPPVHLRVDCLRPQAGAMGLQSWPRATYRQARGRTRLRQGQWPRFRASSFHHEGPSPTPSTTRIPHMKDKIPLLQGLVWPLTAGPDSPPASPRANAAVPPPRCERPHTICPPARPWLV